MPTVLRVLEVIAGVLLVAVVLDAAIRTFVLPRGVQVRLTRAVSLATRAAFDALARPNRDHAARDRVLALYGPVTLLTLPLVWIGLTWFGFTLIYQGLLDVTFLEAARDSGSSLFTLGFAVPAQGWSLVVVFIEATVGLGLLALLISYLPTIYGTFSRRELAVTQLSVRAGSPPSPVEMLTRAHRAGYLLQLDPYWTQWEHWFVELEETHTSLALVSFFRSPDPLRHWLVAAAVVLDSLPRCASPPSTCRSRPPPACASAPTTSRCAPSPGSSTSPSTTTPDPTTRSASSGPSWTRWSTSSWRPGCPSRPIATRSGATSPGGGSTTTPCWWRWRGSTTRRRRRGSPIEGAASGPRWAATVRPPAATGGRLTTTPRPHPAPSLSPPCP